MEDLREGFKKKSFNSFALIKLNYFKNQHFSFFSLSPLKWWLRSKKNASFSSHFPICDIKNMFIWIGWGSYLRRQKSRLKHVYSIPRLKENVPTSIWKLENLSFNPMLSLAFLVSFLGNMVKNFWEEETV